MIGFTLGKFLPPHTGHLHLIRESAKQVDHMYVLMCSIEREPIPGHLRYQWLRKIFAREAHIQVIHVTDENPQEPIEHPDFWRIWAGTFERNLPEKPDIFFSSEHYGFDLERELGIKHHLIDLHRQTVSISARYIRQEPFRYWDFIPEVVRPYFVKKVVLTGPESVGKSTLAQQLAQHFQTHWLPEYGREYYEQVMPHFDYLGISHIAGGHLMHEEEALLRANKILFLDTDLILTEIWSEIYFQRCPEWIRTVNHLPAQRADLYLLLKPDVPWVNDGTRSFGHIREEQFNQIRKELEKRHLPYRVVEGTFEERKQKAIDAVKNSIVPNVQTSPVNQDFRA
jgi:NadR type nicotinamide-nucleotide adenylyltransferase